MSQTHVELSDIITPLKKIVRRPSSPSSKSKASSPTLNAEPQTAASTSTLNDKGTEKVEEKQRHSILGLFTRKHQPPTSLENLPLKVLHRINPKSDSATTPSGSLTFLQRLSFHTKQSPTTPHVSFPNPQTDSNILRPNELLLPVKEVDSTITDEGTSDTHTSNGELVASPIPDEQWFEPPVQTTEIDFRPSALKNSRLSTTHQEIVEAESVRDATIRELEEFLVEFRNGKLRTLKDKDLAAMRLMHTEQSAISIFQMQIHNQLMEYGNFADTMDFDEQYCKLGEKLDHLHNLMENFGGLSNAKTPIFE
uniref:Uncharacterized protein n=1 Tax=Panagrolaimus superbus TaxID=310955 RepID=A0A914Y5K3_9BILA